MPTSARLTAQQLLFATLLSVVYRPATAQETRPETIPGSPSTLRVSSSLVVLDVVVTDKAGQLRNNLKREDFQITEEGVAQTITSFEPPSTHALASSSLASIASTADLERQAPQAPVSIIVLDELNTRFEDMAYARYSLKKYLNAQPGQFAAPTMLIAVSYDHFLVLHDYTQDRDAILTALDRHLTSYPWRLRIGIGRVRQMAMSLGALEQVAQATAGHPGHKNLIWVGHGFPGIDLASPTLDSNAAKGIDTAVQQAVNLLRDARVTLYTVDPTPLSSTVATKQDDNSPLGEIADATGADPFSGSVQFTALAAATGGKSFYSRNDVDREIGESVRDGVNYYTLAYRPTSQSEGGKLYRKIRIRLDLPGLRAGYRDGYYTRDEGEPTPNPGRVVYDLHAAEESTLAYTGLNVSAAFKPGTPDTFVIGLPERQLTWATDGEAEAAKLTLVAVAMDNQGRIIRRITNEVTAHRTAGRAAAEPATGLARVQITLPTSPNVVRFRFVVRAGPEGKIGSCDLPVPGAPPRQNRNASK